MISLGMQCYGKCGRFSMIDDLNEIEFRVLDFAL